MSEFVAGFAARHDTAAHILQAAFAPPMGFAARETWTREAREPAAARPRHFSPADPATRPTEGWDPLDAEAEPSSFINPVETAHAAGYAEGLAAAAAAARETGDRDRALLTELTAALANGHQLDRERIAGQLRQTVMFLVAQLVGEVGVSPEWLTSRIEAAAELLAESSESALLRLNPADVPMIESGLPKSIFAAGDATISRGSFVLESASTVVEDGPALWLDQLAQVIDRIPVPSAC
ncbi:MULTISPECIES: FliH/SctL family protein [unclassified Sphingomonas]|uniref:FliH/SctL family protein n=1 Tax=unclassified Sphingomonas TaxID=196159 RepID=UPI00226ADF86|nr:MULTISPECIES: FliH/SctL family protein [unclassified Sphingomonas]